MFDVVQRAIAQIEARRRGEPLAGRRTRAFGAARARGTLAEERERGAVHALVGVERWTQEEWQRFYAQHQPVITSAVAHVLLARRIPFTRHDLDDFVGEVWVALLRHDALSLRRFDPRRGRSVASWLRLLATRATIDQLRGRATQQRYREVEAEVEPACEESTRPDARLETKQLARVAQEALGQLRPRDLQFLQLCLDEVDPGALAARLGISVSTVHSRKSKISAKLHRLVHRQQSRARLQSQTRPLLRATA